jgi:uncharacterized membrane protein YcaP (DUF421 family)
MTLTEFFGPTGHITWWQECNRAIVIFLYGLAAVRLSGRRVFGKWSALDIIVSIVVGSNLSRALTGGAEMGGTLAATTLLLALHWILAHSAARSRFFSRIIEGGPIELAQGGNQNGTTLRRQAISRWDLEEALRQSGVEHIRDTSRVVLEPSGKITILKKG